MVGGKDPGDHGRKLQTERNIKREEITQVTESWKKLMTGPTRQFDTQWTQEEDKRYFSS